MSSQRSTDPAGAEPFPGPGTTAEALAAVIEEIALLAEEIQASAAK